MTLSEIQPLPVVCRQSCINCAEACERKWFFQYRIGVRLRGVQYKEGATLGKIFHRFQLEGPSNESKVKDWVREKQVALMAQVEKAEDLDGEIQRLANNLTSLYKKAKVMTRIFWAKFPQPTYLETLGREITHQMEWEGLILEGIIDKLLRNTQEGHERDGWIRDYKSTGLPLALLFGGLPWSVQGRLYRVLADDYCRENSLDVTIRGFILDGILKPGIKCCRTDDKNAKTWDCSVEEAYLRRVTQWYKDYEVKADINGQDVPKAMDSKGIFFTESMFPEELKTVLLKMKKLATYPIEPEWFHRDITRTACFTYQKQCVYHPLCETDPNQWGGLFDTKYKLINSAEAQNEKEDL